MSLIDTQLRNLNSNVFDESGTLDPTTPLKPKDPLREAFIITELSHLPKQALKEFVKSKEAKMLLEEEVISYDTLDRMVKDTFHDCPTEIASCYLAKENGDKLWDELVAARAEERRIMNSILATYGGEASEMSEKLQEMYVNKYVPETFRTNK